MVSVKQGGITYYFLSIWYDSTWDWTPFCRTIGEHSIIRDRLDRIPAFLNIGVEKAVSSKTGATLTATRVESTHVWSRRINWQKISVVSSRFKTKLLHEYFEYLPFFQRIFLNKIFVWKLRCLGCEIVISKFEPESCSYVQRNRAQHSLTFLVYSDNEFRDWIRRIGEFFILRLCHLIIEKT